MNALLKCACILIRHLNCSSETLKDLEARRLLERYWKVYLILRQITSFFLLCPFPVYPFPISIQLLN